MAIQSKQQKKKKTTKKNTTKKKVTISVSQKAKVVKKGTTKKDTIPEMDVQMPRSNNVVLKLKVKRK